MEDKKKKQSETLKKVFRYLGKYRIFVVISIFLAALTVALTLYIPKLTGKAVDYIVTKGQVRFAGVFQVMMQIGICVLIKGAGYTAFSDAFTFALLIAILLFKPNGLFGEKLSEKV